MRRIELVVHMGGTGVLSNEKLLSLGSRFRQVRRCISKYLLEELCW
jgi:hypothetical protein